MSPWVISHNAGLEGGAAGSMASFADTLESGCDGVEFDIRRRPDGALVVSHDPVFDTAPLLEDVLALLGHRLVCNLELKEDGYVAEVLEIATRHLPPRLLLVTSALDAAVTTASELGARTGLVVGRLRDPVPTAQELARRAEATGASYLVARHDRVPLDLLPDTRTLVWTVNEEAALRELLGDPRVDGVITDYPRRAVAIRDTPR